jgi:hypothetical protein
VACCGSITVEFENTWLLAWELLGVDSNPLDECRIVIDVDRWIEDEKGLNCVGLAASVKIKTVLEVLVLNDVGSNILSVAVGPNSVDSSVIVNLVIDVD